MFKVTTNWDIVLFWYSLSQTQPSKAFMALRRTYLIIIISQKVLAQIDTAA